MEGAALLRASCTDGRQRGQALAELLIVTPLLVAAVAGGLTLTRLAVAQAEVSLAAIVGASAPEPAAAARHHLQTNRLLDGASAVVQVQQLAWLRRVTVTCRVPLGWWPGVEGGTVRELSATAARGRALLCVRHGR